jgi:hypothetical protein
MVPSNTLSSTDASSFALKVIEGPIFLDYLSETLNLSSLLVESIHPGVQDWWDVGAIDYARVLAERHKGRVTFQKLRADRKLPRPDISTYDGPRVLRFAFGDITKSPPLNYPGKGKGRSEFYEIKPDNKKGEADALDKLAKIEESYFRHNISGIYSRGSVYPFMFTKTIPLSSRFISVWRYLVSLWLASLRVSIISIDIVVRRKHSGVLLYKICVTLDGADRMTKDQAYVIANFAVRMLLKIRTIGAGPEAEAAALAITQSLEPDEPLHQPSKFISPVIAGKDFSKMPYLSVEGLIAEEVKEMLPAIRDTMYSRMMGAPGDQYYLCCDQAYFTNMIQGPILARIRSVKSMLGTGGAIRSASGFSMLTMLPAVAVTGKEMAQIAPELGIAAGKWIINHPMETVIIVSVAVAVTAALILSAGTVAVPGAVTAEGTLTGISASGLAGTVTTVEAASGAVAAEASVGVPTAIMTQTPGAASAASAAVPDVVLATGNSAGTAVSSTSAWLQTTLATRATATELAEAATQQRIDKLLIKALEDTTIKRVLPSVVAGGAATVIGFSSSTAYAAPAGTPSRGNPGLPPEGTQTIGTSLGSLYLIKVPKLIPYPLSQPALYADFDADRYKDKTQNFGAPQPAIGTVKMLGVIRVT